MTHEKYVEAARVKRGLNELMNLRELSAAYGIAYNRARQLSFQAGFPMVRGLVFPAAFEAWMAAGPRSRRAGDPQPNGAGKGRAPGLRNGSRVAWQQLEQSLLSAGLSHASP